MRIRKPLRPELLRVALALLTIWVAIPLTVVSGYLPVSVTSQPIALTTGLVGAGGSARPLWRDSVQRP